MLERLLCDYISPLIPINTLLSSAGITFPYNKFYVCIYTIESVENDSAQPLTNKNEIFYALKNVSFDVFQERYIIEFTEIADSLVCIINMPQDLPDNIKTMVSYITEFFKDNMNVTLKYSLSPQQNSLSEIGVGYKTCMSQLQSNSDKTQKYLNKLNDIEIISKKFNDNYLFIENYATKLIDYVKQGNGELAVAYIAVQLSKGLHYAASTSNLKALLYDLLVSVMTSSKNTNLQFIDDFSSIENSDEALKYFNYTIIKISEPFIHNEIQESGTSYSIYKFICDNFDDINLSVQMIGNSCNKVPSYASKIFSTEFDINLMIYIQLFRINMAIRLLKQTTKSVNVISMETGFSNANVFIRTFKKHTNITPGQYRSLINHDNFSDEDELN